MSEEKRLRADEFNPEQSLSKLCVLSHFAYIPLFCPLEISS
jgi:hypothetical protein